MAGISEAKVKVENGLYKGICKNINHSSIENYYFVDDENENVELSTETITTIVTNMNIEIKDLGLIFGQQAEGSDLDIAKNILPGDKIELHILDDTCAIWLKDGEEFDKHKHLIKRTSETIVL